MTTLMLILFIIAVVFFSTALGRELRRKALSKGVEPNPMIRMKHDKIQSDPCIRTIVQFVKAARGIPEHVKKSGCIIYFYGRYGKSEDKDIFCLYRSFSDGQAQVNLLAGRARMDREEGREINPEIIAGLRRELNFDQFPEGTQVSFEWRAITEDYSIAEDYTIGLHVKPTYTGSYPNYMPEYSDVIAEVCRQEGLAVRSVQPGEIQFEHF